MDHLYLFAWPHAFVYAFLTCLHFSFICLHVFVLHCHNVERVSHSVAMAFSENGHCVPNKIAIILKVFQGVEGAKSRGACFSTKE